LRPIIRLATVALIARGVSACTARAGDEQQEVQAHQLPESDQDLSPGGKDQIAPRTCAPGAVHDPPVPGGSTGAREPPSRRVKGPLWAWAKGKHERQKDRA
jgi:hypothetical protein